MYITCKFIFFTNSLSIYTFLLAVKIFIYNYLELDKCKMVERAMNEERNKIPNEWESDDKKSCGSFCTVDIKEEGWPRELTRYHYAFPSNLENQRLCVPIPAPRAY